jgi:3-oxoacid CoA-transferase subunit A
MMIRIGLLGWPTSVQPAFGSNLMVFLDAFKAGRRALHRLLGFVPMIDGSRRFRLIVSNNFGNSFNSLVRLNAMNKVYPDAKSALDGILKDGMMVMSGGFGLCGIAEALSDALRESGVKNLTVVSNNAGVDGIGLSRLLETRQIKKMISSYVGENKLFAQQYLAGELELEFNPQGTLAERIRAGGAGIPGFYTKTGVGTLIAEGKDVREFNGEKYILETGLVADLAIVHAWKGDTAGNLVYRKTARNFNPMMATAAKITVAEVEHLVPAGEIDPDHIHTPGVFVKRIIEVGTANKRIEQRTTRKRA